MGRKFQVLPIKLSLKGNKFAKSREIVSENQLTSPAVDLIAAGFIKEVFDDKAPIEKEVEVIKIDSAEIQKKDVDAPIEKEVIADIKKAPKEKK